MNIEKTKLDAGDILNRWNDYANKNGGNDKAIARLPESEREALYDVTGLVKETPFVFSSDRLAGLESLANRLKSSDPSKPDEESVVKIQKAMFHNPEFAKSALRDRVAQGKSYIEVLKGPKSPWGLVHVSQNTMMILMKSLIQRANFFEPEVRDAFEKTIKNSEVYQKLQSETVQDVLPLVPMLDELLNQLDSSLSK